MNPALCRVVAYSDPGLPRPTTRRVTAVALALGRGLLPNHLGFTGPLGGLLDLKRLRREHGAYDLVLGVQDGHAVRCGQVRDVDGIADLERADVGLDVVRQPSRQSLDMHLLQVMRHDTA